MSEEILNEIVEETEETEVEETKEETTEDVFTEETPVEDSTTEETEETLPEIELPPQRVNPFCVISKNTFGEYAVRDIQTNSGWGANPYEDYAVVPDEMVLDIMETCGFCDIELNEDGTEVVAFTALEIPEIPKEEVTAEPTTEDVLNALLGLEV